MLTYEDKLKNNVVNIRRVIDILVENGHSRFDEFAISMVEMRPSLYLRNRWQLEELWNRNVSICHTEVASKEKIVQGIEKADAILFETGNIAIKRHIFPKDPNECLLPFFFLELANSKTYPQIVLACHSIFRKTIKQYMLPVKMPSKVAQASMELLRPYVPECAWEYLFEILQILNIVFQIKPHRNSIAGNCRLDRIEGVAYVTLNANTNKWKFLGVVLHEISHAINPSQYSPHDALWKSIYSALLADFYDFFPNEYKSEIVWGMINTPASLRATNFYGRAVIFGISDVLTEENRSKNLLDLQKLKPATLAKDYSREIRSPKEVELNFTNSNKEVAFEDLGKRCGIAAKLVKIYIDKGILDFKTLARQMSKDHPIIFSDVKSSLRGVWNYVAEQVGLSEAEEISKDEAESIYKELENSCNSHKDDISSSDVQTNGLIESLSFTLKGTKVSGFSIFQDDIAPCNLPYDFSYLKNTFLERLELRRKFSGDLYIPLDLKTDQRFFRFLEVMPKRTQRVVWDLYAKEYGEGAYRYACNTAGAWKDGSVKGWAAARFFDIVPLVFPLSRKKELFKTILEASDSVRYQQLRHYDSNPNQVMVSISDFDAKSAFVISYLESFGTKEASEFDYEKIYNFSGWGIPLWMKQSDIELYCKELSLSKKNEILSLVKGLEVKIKQLKNEFMRSGKASLTIKFPSKSFSIRVVSPIRGVMHKIAKFVGFSKDFL